MDRAARIRRPPNVAPEHRPLLDAVDQALAANRSAIQNGILTDEYEFDGAATVRIPHGLGRPLRGWYPVRIRARTFIVFYEDLDDTEAMGNMADSHFSVTANDACVVQFWVW